MIRQILEAAGFVERVTYTETAFVKPPKTTFVVYFDDVDADGADDTTAFFTHSVRFELYAPDRADAAAERRLEGAMNALGVHYRRLSREWLESERYFMTTYDFEFFTKKEN